MEKNTTVPTSNNVEEQKKSSGSSCLIGCLIALGILLVLAVAGYFGIKAVLASFKTTDLGSQYVAGEYKSAFSDLQFSTDNVEKLCLECTDVVFSNPHEVDVVVSGSEVASFLDASNAGSTIGKFENSQVKFSDNKVELSTNFTYQSVKYPVYVSGNIAKDTATSITGEVFEVKAGPIALPSNIGSLVEDALVSVANQKLSSMGDNVRIDEVSFTDAGVHFKGLVPGSAE